MAQGRQDLVPQVVRPGAEGARGHDDGGRLRGEAEASPPGHPAERAQRRPLGALTAREAGAVRALAQMRAQLGALGARQGAIEVLRDRELRLGAGEHALELLAQRTTRPEDEGLDGGRRHVEHLGDLGI